MNSFCLRLSLLFTCMFLMSNGRKASPNIILFLTDDQDVLLDGLVPMKNALELIANEGVIFKNAFVNSPICCPSRSTLLTGQYQHNTGVVNNSISGNCSSIHWQNTHEKRTIATFLKELGGYKTFYAGKYLNQYGSEHCGGIKHVPPGYDWWIGLKGNSRYYNYVLSINGHEKFFQDQYLTDVLENYTLQFLNEEDVRDKPFFMIISPPAPHSPFTPAKRHANAFPRVKAKRTPSFNYTPFNKHWLLQLPPINLPVNVTTLDQIQRGRQQTLLSVDEMIMAVTEKLQRMEVLNDTYVIFTSDNGFHIGQFGQPWDKRQPYETDIRVPLMIRGPNVLKKKLVTYPVSFVDILPTILEFAGIKIPGNIDGSSFKKKIEENREDFNKTLLTEYHGEGNPKSVDSRCPWAGNVDLSECALNNWCKCEDSKNNTYNCLRQLSSNNFDMKYCFFKDNENFVEVYDLISDPNELINIYKRIDNKRLNKAQMILEKFIKCSGKSCLEISNRELIF